MFSVLGFEKETAFNRINRIQSYCNII